MSGIDGVLGPGFSGMNERAQLQRTAQELEAVVVTQLLESMRNSVPEGGLFEKSAADDVFRSMLDGELARVVARKSPFGLADAIMDRLGERLQEADAPAESMGEAGPGRKPNRSWRI
ncbi:rod-binding protein [bacterium]|nr:rod-binding protein [bacterium]